MSEYRKCQCGTIVGKEEECCAGARPDTAPDAQLLDEAAVALDRYEWQDIIADVQVRGLVERLRARASELRASAAPQPERPEGER